MVTKFIDISREYRDSKDGSSLLVKPDYLEVVGNLPHSARIAPRTANDERALMEWLLKRYIGVIAAHTALDVIDSLREVNCK